MVIAIDGFSSTGKSTLAKQLAAHLGFVYVDTGAMYRAVTLYALRNGLEEDEERLISHLTQVHIELKQAENEAQKTFLNQEDVTEAIREMDVSKWVSPISTISQVRKFLVDQQRKMGDNQDLVMDGRDIGTVVFPNAELKIFVTAAPSIRAERRYNELKENGKQVSMTDVMLNLQERDHIDSTRKDSPLRQADDAKVLDNSLLSMEDQLSVAVNWYQEVLNEASNSSKA